MAINTTTINDTFNEWRVNTNTDAISIGDIDLLNPGLGANNLVEAVNNILAGGGGAFTLFEVDSNIPWDSTPGDQDGLFIQFSDALVGHIDAVSGVGNSSQLRFGTHNSTDNGVVQLRLLINEDGNYGIRTSDIENWSVSYTAIEIGSNMFIAHDTGSTGSSIFGRNAYFDGGWKYKDTNTAQWIVCNPSGVIFAAHPSGTIDNAISNANANIGTLTPTITSFNINQNDINYQISSDTKANAFYLLGSTGFVGFNTLAPKSPLHIFSGTGAGSFTPSVGVDELLLENSGNTGASFISTNNARSSLILGRQNDPDWCEIRADHSNNWLNISLDSSDRIRFSSTEFLFNVTGADIDFRIATDGNFNTFMVNGSLNSVGINQTTPHVSAIFEIVTTGQGILIPRMTTAQKNAVSSPAQGLMIYDTDEERLSTRDDTAEEWVNTITEDDVIALVIALG